jgi:hypothetical protein
MVSFISSAFPDFQFYSNSFNLTAGKIETNSRNMKKTWWSSTTKGLHFNNPQEKSEKSSIKSNHSWHPSMLQHIHKKQLRIAIFLNSLLQLQVNFQCWHSFSKAFGTSNIDPETKSKLHLSNVIPKKYNTN